VVIESQGISGIGPRATIVTVFVLIFKHLPEQQTSELITGDSILLRISVSESLKAIEEN
jgi:hypothetical protein